MVSRQAISTCSFIVYLLKDSYWKLKIAIAKYIRSQVTGMQGVGEIGHFLYPYIESWKVSHMLISLQKGACCYYLGGVRDL
jgi:hypothetical protein